MAKNGLPAVFSCTSFASGVACSGWQRRESAINRPKSSWASGARLTDRFEPARQRMGGIDFVVAVSTDHHQVLHIRPGQQILEQIQRRRVQPLQVIEKQEERMFRSCEYADETPEDQLEAMLRVLWRQLRNGWLLPD